MTNELIVELSAEDRGVFEIKWDEVRSELGSMQYFKQLESDMKNLCLKAFGYGVQYERSREK